jgi:hypothetical protein
LFVDPNMFDSRDDFRDAGFDVLGRSSDSKIMVGSHPSARDYLFKKYARDISLKEQHGNYLRRVEGVRRLRALITDKDLQSVIVPRKQLYELPSKFGSRDRSSYVLIVERLPILDSDRSERAYHRIDEDVLRDLCTVCYMFPGLDSNAKNIPFTEDGRIAFIDTEHWDRHSDRHKRKKPYLRHIHGYLSHAGRDLAEKIFKELEDEDA